MIILSILYNSHNTSVALVKNGKILFAASEERYSRRKMDHGVPLRALRACFAETKIKPSQIDEVVFVSDPFPRSLGEYYKLHSLSLRETGGRYLFWLKSPISALRVLFFASGLPFYLALEVYPQVRLRMALSGFKGKYTFMPHHESHLYSAYHTAPWKTCLVACFEGGGLTKSTSVYFVKNGNWKKITETSLPHSPGAFYALVTAILGFKPLRHEGKITGLSAYGDPKKAYSLVKKLMWVESGEIKYDYPQSQKIHAHWGRSRTLPKSLAKHSREDIAAAFQRRLEECVAEVVEYAINQYKTDKIALAGGVVANVKLNQRIFEIPAIAQIYVHPGMGDEGVALGAALKRSNAFVKLENVYFGSSHRSGEVRAAFKKYRVMPQKVKNIEKAVARLLAEGKVVARYSGRMEYGPRALGNRTILASATDKTINDTLNKKLKRTEFMPFAPVTTESMAPKLFKNLKGSEYTSRFMTITYDCTPFMKKKCPAVVHVDGTARPQIIRRSANPSYYKIVSEYIKLTGVPALINTSFNMHEEPIVESPDDAVRSFLAGELDFLALDNYLLAKKS